LVHNVRDIIPEGKIRSQENEKSNKTTV